MQIRALKTFMGRNGLIRTGLVVTVDDRYANQLITKGLVARHVEPIGPKSNAAIDEAPQKKIDEGDDSGKGQKEQSSAGSEIEETAPSPSPENGSGTTSSEDQPEGGLVTRSPSRRRARPSRKKT
jgi:hypothetical protein